MHRTGEERAETDPAGGGSGAQANDRSSPTAGVPGRAAAAAAAAARITADRAAGQSVGRPLWQRPTTWAVIVAALGLLVVFS